MFLSSGKIYVSFGKMAKKGLFARTIPDRPTSKKNNVILQQDIRTSNEWSDA